MINCNYRSTNIKEGFDNTREIKFPQMQSQVYIKQIMVVGI